jgi:hypothetical protein
MIVKICVSHTGEPTSPHAKILYSCDTSSPGIDDPLPATAAAQFDESFRDFIGNWVPWETFSSFVDTSKNIQVSEVSVDLLLESFPQPSEIQLPMMVKQGDALKMFFSSLKDFVPRLREDMSGVWIRVD